MAISIDDMIRDVGRELGMRKACYSRWVASGKLTQDKADHQIACMDAVYALLKKLKDGITVSM